MKTLIKKIFFILFFFGFVTFSNAQYFINQFDGIPIIIGAPDDISIPEYEKMEEMGANFVITNDLTQIRLNEIKHLNFKVIPAQGVNLFYNYVMKYTEGAYTKWEAEGTPLGKGDATIEYNQDVCTTFVEGSREGIKTLPGAGYDTLIRGPGYAQERRYWRIDTGYVDYNAEFNLMLSTIIPEGGSPNDTICILQVTDSEIVGPPSKPYRDSTIFIRDTVLLRSDFTPGVWQPFNLIYNFRDEESDGQQPSNQLPNYTYQNYQSNDPVNKNHADFVQYKIIWKGDLYTRLYVDNIIVSDNKGWQIINDLDIKNLILTQATQSFYTNDLDNYVAAWFAIDEPETIDNYEPIRIVDSLLKDASDGKRGLWVSFPSSWNGKYGDSHLGAQPLFKSKEFLLRTGLSPHQNNHPLYHYPFTPENINNYHPGDDYRDWNIKYLADTIMNRVNDWDPNFSITLICGKYVGAYLEHDPLPHEMLY
ncbi:MAG TPA: hypothetical protein PLT78_15710, partial [Ignavibacteriaceae bacterium]|nr:hypothetical protein [Ignavibacteriaceae bacterium]